MGLATTWWRAAARGLLASIGFLLVLTQSAIGQAASPLLVGEVLTPVLEAQPRQTVSLRLSLRNASDSWQRIESNLTVPGGWLVLVPPGEVLLEPRETTVLMANVMVGSNAKAGSHTFPLVFRTSDQESWRQALFTVRVPVIDQASLRVLQAPELVTQDSYQIAFLLENLGNTSHEWSLTGESNVGSTVEIEPRTLTLAPGETTEVRATVTRPGRLEKQLTESVTVVARSTTAPDLSTAATSRSRLIPRALPESAALHTFPVRVRLSYRGGLNSAPTEAGPMLEASGTGKTRPESNVSYGIQLRLRPDEILEHLVLKREAPGFTVRVGTLSFPTSLLTGDASGFGIAVHFDRELWKGVPLAASLSGYLGDSAGVTAMLSSKPLPGVETAVTINRSSEGLLGSFGATYKPTLLDPTSIQLSELGLTYGVRVADAQVGHSLRMEGRLNEGPSYVRLHIDAADAAFTDKDNHSFSVELLSWLRLNEAVRIRPEYPLYLTLRYVGTWKWDRGEPFAFLPPGNASWTADAYGVGLSYAAGPIILAATHNSAVQTENGETEWRTNTTALARAQVGSSLAVAGSVDWGQEWSGGARTGNELDHEVAVVVSHGQTSRFSAALTGTFDLKEGAAEELTFDAKWAGTPLSGLTIAVESEVNLIHPNNDLWSAKLAADYETARGRALDASVKMWSRQALPIGASFSVGYTFPLNVPIGRRSGIGGLEGTVTGIDDRPIAGLTFTVAGQATTTDAEGHYRFPVLPAGEHLLRIEAAGRLPVTQILAPASPRAVIILDRTVTRLDFVAVEGSALSGVIDVGTPESSGGLVGDVVAGPDAGQGIEIELRSSRGEVLRAITDSAGAFHFSRLMPGEWELRVRSANLPNNYRLEAGGQILFLEPGEAERVTVKLVPTVRRIEFTDEGDLTPTIRLP